MSLECRRIRQRTRRHGNGPRRLLLFQALESSGRSDKGKSEKDRSAQSTACSSARVCTIINCRMEIPGRAPFAFLLGRRGALLHNVPSFDV